MAVIPAQKPVRRDSYNPRAEFIRPSLLIGSINVYWPNEFGPTIKIYPPGLERNQINLAMPALIPSSLIQQIIRAYQILLIASMGFGHLAVQTFDSHRVTDYAGFFGERHIHFKPAIAI